MSGLRKTIHCAVYSHKSTGHDKAMWALLDAYAGGEGDAMHRRLKAGTQIAENKVRVQRS